MQAGTRATHIAYFATGFAFASWASEIPRVRDRLSLSSTGLGLLLLCIAVGSTIMVPLAGPLVSRVGSRQAVQLMAVLEGIALVVVAVGYFFGVGPVVAGLLLFGVTQSAWDVAINVQGAVIERELGRAILSRFHAAWSVGTVAGAVMGAALVSVQVPLSIHLAAAGVAVAVTIPFVVRRFVPDIGEPKNAVNAVSAGGAAEVQAPLTHRGAFGAWSERRTVLIGVFALAFAFAEGIANDWTSVALIDGYGTSSVVGILGLATFLSAMTAGRWFSPALLDRYGRVIVLRGTAVLGAAGALLFVFGTIPLLALVGSLLWGFGASLGFPVAMSAGADQPEHAASRVGVIASIGYVAFLGGPPLIGFLGHELSVLRALMVVPVLLILAILITGVLSPISSDENVRHA